MNLPELAAGLNHVIATGILAAFVFLVIVGFIAALGWAIGGRTR